MREEKNKCGTSFIKKDLMYLENATIVNFI